MTARASHQVAAAPIPLAPPGRLGFGVADRPGGIRE